MNVVQLLKFAAGGLWRQKVRTGLTLVGVTVGTCALAFSLALGLGLRAFIETEFKSRDDFWRIQVRVDQPPPDESAVPPEKIAVTGQMSDARRARIREALLDGYQNNRLRRPPKLLTREAIDALADLPDVREVRTYALGAGRLWADGVERPVPVNVVSGPLADLAPRLIAGRLPAAPDADEMVVSEFALYQLGFRDDADLEGVLDRPMKLVVGGVSNAQPLALAQVLLGRRPPEELTRTQMQALEKVTRALPEKIGLFGLSDAERAEVRKLLDPPKDDPDDAPFDATKTATGTYRVCGVVRLLTRADRKSRNPLDSWELSNGSAFLPPVTGERLTHGLPWAMNRGLLNADVRVAPGGDLPGTVAAIEAMGYQAFSGAKWFASAKREVTLIAAGLNLFALIALFVAAVGITNTLVTSVIERTREIGTLRAVGATRRQIMGLFLTEGALIGLLGAALGLGLAWGLAAAGDDWVRRLIHAQMDGEKMHSTTIFVFPWWLWAGASAFALGVTTLAALYPARRAAKIHPIEALRYG
jgi:putative ABC transport system permease protein